MTFTSPIRKGVANFSYNKILDVDNRAIGAESSVINNEYIHSIEHYLRPISRQWSNPVTRFFILKAKWENETAMFSSVTEIVMHPSYQQIIGMGPIVIPLILSELQKKTGHWFWALKSITGEDPVLPEQRGRVQEMTKAWLRWGMKQGYLLSE